MGHSQIAAPCRPAQQQQLFHARVSLTMCRVHCLLCRPHQDGQARPCVAELVPLSPLATSSSLFTRRGLCSDHVPDILAIKQNHMVT